MGKTANRIGALGVLAAAAALLLAGNATADTADPAIAGNCDATVTNGAPGQALTVDAGAPLNAPNSVTVGTGSDSANSGAGAASKPALALPVADLAKTLNVGNLPIAGAPVANIVCPGLQNTVNALSATTQSLVAGKPLQPAPPAPSTPPPSNKPSPQPPATPAPATGTPGDSQAAPANGGVVLASLPANVINPLSDSNLAALIAPGAVAPSAPGLVPPAGAGGGIVNQNSGTAQALPAPSNAADKLPLLLAAIALALVAAALSKVWIRRSVK